MPAGSYEPASHGLNRILQMRLRPANLALQRG
jgi:hypothetical protein